MSPAGAAASMYRRVNLRGPIIALAVVGLAVWLITLIPGAAQARSAPAAVSGPWAAFDRECVNGPSPGQGNALSSCECWTRNLQAVAIGPAYALDTLDAADVGEGAAYTVPENIGNLAINQAMNGCGLYGG